MEKRQRYNWEHHGGPRPVERRKEGNLGRELGKGDKQGRGPTQPEYPE